jgi:UDP-glucuronate 4-epimerase
VRVANRILVTGAAGFIGFHVAEAFLRRGDEVLGVDNLSPYYDVGLKRARLDILKNDRRFHFAELDIAAPAFAESFAAFKPTHVVNLAAQAGVRYSLTNPRAYVDANLVGFLNVLEACRHHRVEHLVYASTSSVYGANTKMPFTVEQNVDHPLSLYAATKKANELMAHSYAHLYRLPTTGLRFFTVYGPWGRPDMAMFLFTKAILAGEPIKLFNHGRMQRDFTYIDDIAAAVVKVTDIVATPDPAWRGDAPSPATSNAPWRVYNIGNNRSVEVLRVVELLEAELGRKAVRDYVEMQPGDVPATCADVEALAAVTGFAPNTPIEEGVHRFVRWYRDYYGN